MVFVTHDIAEAILLADRIGMIDRTTIHDHRGVRHRSPAPRDLTHPKVAQLFHEIEALLEPDIARSEQHAAAE